jgi:RNase P subunit RPR2
MSDPTKVPSRHGPVARQPVQQVAKARKGVALCTATRDGTCSVCHVRLRPPVFQKVRQNDSIVQCEICQRILYYVPPPPQVEAPVVHSP